MKLSIDIGYGHIKVFDGNKTHKFQTKIEIFEDTGVNYGNLKIYEFEGKKYLVGEENGGDGLTILEGKMLKNFFPLLIEFVLDKLNYNSKDTKIVSGLALVDWDLKDEIIERVEKFGNKIKLIPQGMGIYFNFLKNKKEYGFEENPRNMVVIDIGFNTINFLSIKNNKFDRLNSKTYPNHGVSSIVLQLKTYLEKTFKISYDMQETNEILVTEKFKFQGKEYKEVIEFIKRLKKNFLFKLFNTVLVEDKKILSKADLVFISGGGSYLLRNSKFPDNTIIDKVDMEFSNVKGYYYYN